MTTTVGVRKILDLKRWEFCAPLPTATVAASFVVSSRHYRQQQLYVVSNTVAYLYQPNEDAFVQLSSPALGGTFGAGACGAAAGFSTGSTVGAASLTATGGSTSTIITNQTLARDLRGYSVQILAGPNAGVTLTIVSNTIGSNATITVATQASAFTASTVYRLMTPVWYVLGAGTLASGIFKKYCFATNSWVTLTQTGLPATISTDSKLISTPSWIDDGFKTFATGTATSATGTTLVNSAKAWATNQWANSQVRITGGTGAGQIRIITSNTGTTLTVPTWTITPDATSVYAIEGNDDYIYYIGSNAVTTYRYSITSNSWTTLSPTAARAAAPTTGMSGHWVWGSTEADWTAENAIKNGRYIYSFRGGAGMVLDAYDIALNTWVSGITVSPAAETFTTGTKYAYVGNYLYIQKDATGRWMRYNFATQELDGWSTMTYTQGAAVLGDTAFDVTYHDGATDVVYIQMFLNTSTVNLRQMVV
jgi:hypothetical protein